MRGCAGAHRQLPDLPTPRFFNVSRPCLLLQTRPPQIFKPCIEVRLFRDKDQWTRIAASSWLLPLRVCRNPKSVITRLTLIQIGSSQLRWPTPLISLSVMSTMKWHISTVLMCAIDVVARLGLTAPAQRLKRCTCRLSRCQQHVPFVTYFSVEIATCRTSVLSLHGMLRSRPVASSGQG